MALSRVIVDGGAPSRTLDSAARIDCVLASERKVFNEVVPLAARAPILWIVGSYSGGKLTVAPKVCVETAVALLSAARPLWVTTTTIAASIAN